MNDAERLAYDKGQNDRCQYTEDCCLKQDNSMLRVEIERLNSELAWTQAELASAEEAYEQSMEDNKDLSGELELWQRENAELKKTNALLYEQEKEKIQLIEKMKTAIINFSTANSLDEKYNSYQKLLELAE